MPHSWRAPQQLHNAVSRRQRKKGGHSSFEISAKLSHHCDRAIAIAVGAAEAGEPHKCAVLPAIVTWLLFIGRRWLPSRHSLSDTLRLRLPCSTCGMCVGGVTPTSGSLSHNARFLWRTRVGHSHGGYLSYRHLIQLPANSLRFIGCCLQ